MVRKKVVHPFLTLSLQISICMPYVRILLPSNMFVNQVLERFDSVTDLETAAYIYYERDVSNKCEHNCKHDVNKSL